LVCAWSCDSSPSLAIQGRVAVVSAATLQSVGGLLWRAAYTGQGDIAVFALTLSLAAVLFLAEGASCHCDLENQPVFSICNSVTQVFSGLCRVVQLFSNWRSATATVHIKHDDCKFLMLGVLPQTSVTPALDSTSLKVIACAASKYGSVVH
jgi:hypothetical protein